MPFDPSKVFSYNQRIRAWEETVIGPIVNDLSNAVDAGEVVVVLRNLANRIEQYVLENPTNP